jgi:sec-independent protein translocase protein TatB
MFGLSGGEVLTLLVLGFILMGPKRLPGAAKQAAIFIKKARTLAAGATAELRESLGPEFSDLDITDLNPKNLVKKQLAGVLDDHVQVINESIIVPNEHGVSAQPKVHENNETNQSIVKITKAQIDPDLI